MFFLTMYHRAWAALSLIVLANITAVAAQCSSYSGCSSCVLTADCHWCIDSGTCNDVFSEAPCEKTAAFQIECPLLEDSDLTAVAFACFAVAASGVLIVFLVKRSAVSSLIAAHSTRRNDLDLSAFRNNAEIDAALKQKNEPLIWADVSMRVPRIGIFVVVLLAAVIGVVFAMLGFDMFPQVFVSIGAAFLLLPSVVYIIIGVIRIFSQTHYSELYGLSFTGAVIIRPGLFGKSTHYFPYRHMQKVESTAPYMNTGCVYFAEAWTEERDEHDHLVQRKVKVGFENIVHCNEAEAIVRRNVY